ncbi:MAG: helix-turn-helix transcriptional regulator [Actinobacteria bacterium]|nr:helix-turn-helix transcriptional regulator [Actinomycetota bacterium]
MSRTSAPASGADGTASEADTAASRTSGAVSGAGAAASRTSSAPTEPAGPVMFETADRERGHEYLAKAYGVSLKITDSGGNYQLRHVRSGPGSFYIDTVAQTVTTEYQAGPMASLVAIRMQSGLRAVLDTSAGIDPLGPGGIAVRGQPGQPCHVRLEPSVVTAVVIDHQVAAEVARNAPDQQLGPVRFTSMSPRSAAAARNWRYTVDYITDTVLPNQETASSPLITSSATRLLAATMLATFPNTWIIEPCPLDRADATPSTLRRAIGFIEANADLDITVTDVARAALATSRAVQLAFRRHLDTTPMAYLRRVRLERAHEQLRKASPDDGVTVTQIAARWGFASPSRFAQHYQAAYGIPPSRTLRT